MSEWLEEIETLERICDETEDCSKCRLGYCIHADDLNAVTSGVAVSTEGIEIGIKEK